MRYENMKMKHISLSDVRIFFWFCAFLHLFLTAVVTLGIDTRVDEDPKIRAYHSIRWKLITCWFNILTLPYLPTRLYCEWRMRRGDGFTFTVMMLLHASDVLMTSILFPVTTFSDLAFWVIFTVQPDLLAPPGLLRYAPYWAQHSLHTVSLVVVILDILLTPRRRPSSLKPRLAILTLFSATYITVIFESCSRGEIIYSICEDSSSASFMLLAVCSYAAVLMLFALQWKIIDRLWSRHKLNNKYNYSTKGQYITTSKYTS